MRVLPRDPLLYARIAAIVGIAAAPEGRTTVDAIVDEADRAMYRHKELGRRRARA